MAIDPKVLIETIKNNIEKIGSRDKEGYKKQLYIAVSDIIAKETEHRNTGAVVNQPYKDIIKRLGAFLNMED